MITGKHNELAHLFKTLAHPARLCILVALEEKEHTVHELQEIVCCRQANVSQHLALLRREHLVKTRREGKKVIYFTNFIKYKMLQNI